MTKLHPVLADAPGAILYRGPSRLNGQPIVCIATGFGGARNVKTGADLVQIYIMADGGAAVTPAVASQSGQDAAACGSCPFRGQYGADGQRIPSSRICYVNLGQGPTIIHKALHAGRYVDLSGAHHATVSALFADRGVRLGSYGDAAALPPQLVRAVLRRARYWTGYTHSPTVAPELQRYTMASAHTPAEAQALQSLGWRTFRVAPAGDTRTLPGEMLCPASKEAGKKLTCQDCKACSGTASGRKANVMIPAHAGEVAAIRRGLVSGL